MSKHSKIPVPKTEVEAEAEAAAKEQAGSLIERVVRNYDLVKLGPAPIPADLVPPAGKRRRYRRHDDAAEEAEISPVSDAAAAHRIDPADIEILPSDPVSEPPAPAAKAPAAKVPAIKPVQFTGPVNLVNRQHLREQGLLVPEGSVTTLLEEFRIIKRQLLYNASQLAQQGMGGAAQRVLICSPHPGDGKSFTAVNLALAIAAEKETEVLLVDADFAKPSVLSMLGLPGGQGLMDALTDPEIDVAKCVISTDVPGLSVLPAGMATASDTEYLSTVHTRAVLDRLIEGAPNRFVIFDSPPALAASPAAELAKYVGQAVVVARCDRTGQGSIEDAVRLLSACPNIQLLLNAVHFSPSGRRFGTYYGYGG